jgi:hypothetical protein
VKKPTRKQLLYLAGGLAAGAGVAAGVGRYRKFVREFHGVIQPAIKKAKAVKAGRPPSAARIRGFEKRFAKVIAGAKRAAPDASIGRRPPGTFDKRLKTLLATVRERTA